MYNVSVVINLIDNSGKGTQNELKNQSSFTNSNNDSHVSRSRIVAGILQSPGG